MATNNSINSSTNQYLPLAGGTMAGALILSTSTPSADLEAASKSYVDTVASGLQPKEAVAAATTANLVGTYLNGVAGVGATFTLTSTGVLAIDGQNVVSGSRYLLKNQSSGFQNGVYDCTVAGAIGVATVFTRSTNYNTANDINAGDLIPVINGTVNTTTTWLQTSTITTVGTDNLVFVQFSGGTPLTTKGDLYGYSTTGARLPVGADYQLPGADSTSSLGISYDYPNFPLTKSSIVQGFEASGGNAGTADNAPVSTQVSGTGAQILLGLGATDGTTFGVAIPETGSTTTGRAYWCGSGAQLYTAGGQVIFEASCKIPTLSNGTDRFAVSIGLTSSIGSGKFPDGAYFYYRDDVNSGNWQCEIALFGSSGTPHITTTSTAAGTSWTRFKIICDPTCGTVTFYINDVSVASDSTAANLPKAVALRTACGLLKSAGTNSLTLQVDYMKLRKDFTTAR